MHDHPVLSLSLSRQCRLLSIGRSSLCYKPKGWNAETLALMRPVDKLFLKYPFYRAACKILIDSERRKNTQASNDVRARQLVRF